MDLEHTDSQSWGDDGLLMWEDEEKMILESNSSKAHESRHPVFHVYSRDEISCRQSEIINDLFDITGLDRDDIFFLLHSYRWNKERLLEEWVADSDSVKLKAGITHIVRTNPYKKGAFSCPLCDNSTPVVDTLYLPCGHQFCRDCWSDWLKVQLSTGATCIYTKCPAAKCSETVTYSFFEKLLDTDSLKKFSGFFVDNYILCCGPDCNNVIEYLPGGIASIECKCGYRFCFGCDLGLDHVPASCEMAKKWILKNTSESENVTWIIANTKVCPKCHVSIEKNQGCNHMSCSNCRHEFCWLCKGDWKTHGTATGGYYECNRFSKNKYSKKSLEDEEKKSKIAKHELQRYMFFWQRFDNHQKSIKFAEKTLKDAMDKMYGLHGNAISVQDTQYIYNAVVSIRLEKN